MTQEEKLIPAKTTHAVVEVAFAIEFAAPVSTDLVHALSSHYDQSKLLLSLLPHKAEERLGRVGDSHSQTPITLADGAARVRFESGAGELEQWSMALRGDVLVVHCSSYTRWESVADTAMALLKEALGVLLPQVSILRIGLQYTDEFFWLGSPEEFSASHLFAQGTTLLPSNVFSLRSSWHSYSGWFEMVNEPELHPQLINLNVSAGVEKDQRMVARIVATHRSDLPEPTNDLAILDCRIRNFFDALHKTNKSVLRLMLNDSIQQRINLDQ